MRPLLVILIIKACRFRHPYLLKQTHEFCSFTGPQTPQPKGTWAKQPVTTFKFLCESELLHDLEHLLTLLCREIRTEGGRNRDNRGYERSRCPDLFDRCGFRPFRHPLARVDGHQDFIAFSHCIEGSVQQNDFRCKPPRQLTFASDCQLVSSDWQCR